MSLAATIAAIWFLLPAGMANMAPVVAAKLFPAWDFPVDFGRSLGGKRLFGAHKTWRGIAAGLLAAAATFAAQKAAYASTTVIQAHSLFDYGRYPVAFGAWLGLGALAGDLAKSFAKRRVGVPPGRPWFPFDQVDWLVGTVLFAWPFLGLSVPVVLHVLLAGLVLHLAAHFLGFLLRLNPTWM